MPRPSSIKRLDPRIRDAVHGALTDGRATTDEIVALIRAMGGEASRSAVGRYRQGFEESLKRYREAQEVAGKWIAQFQADPGGDVGRLLAEMCKTLAFQTMAQAGEGDQPAAPLDIARLAQAVKRLVDTDKAKAELEAKLKARVDQAIEKVAEEQQRKGGAIPAEALRRIREEVYGIGG